MAHPSDFETFKRRQNNFYMHFIGTPGKHHIADMYRDTGAYKQSMEKHPEFAELSEKLRGLCGTLEGDFWEDNIQRPLYEAYVVMCSYVEKDWELFQ